MTDASDRGWGNGWPTDRRSDMVDLTVEGVSFPGGVHRTVMPLMRELLEVSIDAEWVELTDGWCWGYANRPIKLPGGGFSTTPSNHSWGLAIDVNAPANPFGGTSHQIPLVMGNLWESYGFRWGGFYSSTKDWMHFEFMGTPAQVASYLGQLQSREDDVNLETYQKGWDAYVVEFKAEGKDKPANSDPGPPREDKPAWFRNGWNAARFAARFPKAS
jgi:hypothetical protein